MTCSPNFPHICLTSLLKPQLPIFVIGALFALAFESPLSCTCFIVERSDFAVFLTSRGVIPFLWEGIARNEKKP